MWMVRIYDLQTALPLTLLQGTLRLAIWSEAIINEIVTVGRSPSGTSAEGWKKLRVVWLDQNKIQLLMTQYGYHMLSHVITQMFVRYVWTKSHLSWLTDKAFSIGIKNDQNTVVRECPNRRCGSMWGLWSMPKHDAGISPTCCMASLTRDLHQQIAYDSICFATSYKPDITRLYNIL